MGQSSSSQSVFLRFFGLDITRFFCGFGFAFMSTSMACSKLNGKSETGLAFGMKSSQVFSSSFASCADKIDDAHGHGLHH
jgi:hypothetical protein